MKFPFSEQLSRMIGHPDELRPLRELRSPLSTSAIRERVLERMASPPMWGQFRNILAELLVVGVAGAALLKLAGPVELHDLLHGTHRSYGADRINGAAINVGANGIGQFDGIRTFEGQVTLSKEPVNAITPDESPSLFSNNTLRTEPIALTNSVDHLYPILDTRYSAPSIVGDADTRSPIWFASASGGAIFSQIRMLGEHGEIGLDDGWKTIALSYTSGDGNRDPRDIIVHHPSSPALWLSKERDQEFSLLFGAAAQVGPFEFRAIAGPAYLSSSSAYYSLSTGTTGAPVSLQSFGAAAEVSALYKLNSSFEAGIDGTANYHSRQFAGGLFASIEYQFGP